ncbi:MAG: type I DNA topoisomerase [Armatimonadota bacterium]
MPRPKSAIIVESGAKTRTLKSFVGSGYKILASMGHVRDLPEQGLGVDVDDRFTPTYEIIPKQQKVIAQLKKQLKGLKDVYLATDPDREGEAIAWHLATALKLEDPKRIEFNEITKRAVTRALDSPGRIDMDRVNAQQARRVLDRLVGYQISPLLGRRLKNWSLSAGRVQSVALRLICEREREVAAFTPQEYWSVEARLTPQDREEPFLAKVARRDGEKLELGTEDEAQSVVADLKDAAYVVAKITRRKQRRNPPPPFTTSTLQQQAHRELRFSARKTMTVAQQLYEGVEVGGEATAGLITYMRTDSTRIAEEARRAAVQFIESSYGADFVGGRRRDKAAKGAQEAHEAVRPTAVDRRPEKVAQYLSKDQLALYALIWRRFMASQMAPAVYDQTTVDIGAGSYTLRATGSVPVFAGFEQVYREAKDEDKQNNAKGEDVLLPELKEGQELRLLELLPEQHFTKPPPRYTEATLVKALEENGIGRPSTYAPTIEVLRRREYVRMERRRFVPTPLGFVVCDFLVEHFGDIVNVEFTAKMEAQLDTVEQGNEDWVRLVGEFYGPFMDALNAAQEAKPKRLGEKCPQCGGELLEKISAHGKFAGCEKYPECDFTRPIEDPAMPNSETEELDEKCPECGKPLAVRNGRRGRFIGCTGYPECEYTRSLNSDGTPKAPPQETDLACDACGAKMVIREGRRGKFLGCSAYPKCRNTKPLTALEGEEAPQAEKASSAEEKDAAEATGETCEECGKPMVMREGRWGEFLGCSGYPKCRNTKQIKGKSGRGSGKKPSRKKPVVTDIECGECGKPMVIRDGRRGKFLGCSGYPKCSQTQDLPEELLA